MKSYPSIGTKIIRTKVWVFDKLDGSNIRVEWSDKKGFYKFGSRNKLIDENHPVFGEAVDLIKEKEEKLTSIFTKHQWDRVVAFFEYYGLNSFIGSHKDEDHTVTLIDVNVYKHGMLEPAHFIELFGDVGIPKILYIGMVDEKLISDVKQGILNGMTFEGVVCKFKQKNQVKMFKVKNRDWIDRLKKYCNGNDVLFRKLV